MKLIAQKLVTIHAMRHAQRWFPALYRHSDGSLLMYIQYGYDADFAPMGKWRSFDGGVTWREEEENVPRGQIAHVFANGSLLELDAYGYFDPKTEDVFHFYGAWSTVDAGNSVGHSAWYHGTNNKGEDWLRVEVEGTRRDVFTIRSPSLLPQPATNIMHGYPDFPWWPLINRVHPPTVHLRDVFVGINITDVIEHSGVLWSIGYGPHREDTNYSPYSVFCYRSENRGQHWEEVGVVVRGTQSTREGFNEATITRLPDGRFYSVIRSGGLLHHSWSEDEGHTWSTPVPMSLVDSGIQPRMVWPRVAQLEDNTLVLAWGRPGKHLAFDPTGTGTQWQGHLDLHALELQAQAENGVPENQRLRGDTNACVRYWDSSDYLSVVPVGPREMLVTYDVQNYVERAGAVPVTGVRMVRVQLID